MCPCPPAALCGAYLLSSVGSCNHRHSKLSGYSEPLGKHWSALLALPLNEGTSGIGEQRLERALAAVGAVAWEWEVGTGSSLSAGTTALVELKDDPARAFLQLVHPADRDWLLQALAGAVRGTAPYDFEFRLLRPDGTVEWVRDRGQLQRDTQGRPPRMAGVAQLITAEKRTEAAFRATFDQAAIGMAHVAPGGSFLRVNDRLCGILGRPREALLRLGVQNVTHPDDSAADFAQMEALLAGRIADYAMEKRYLRADDTVAWVNLTVSLVRDTDGAPDYFVAVSEDISAHKAAEAAVADDPARTLLDAEQAQERLSRANAELEARVAERTRALSDAGRELAAEMRRREAAQGALLQSQKLEALGHLTSGVAHDFNNILGAITGSYSLIRRRTDSAAVLAIVHRGEQAAERARKLIRQLLIFARREKLIPELLDPATVLRRAEDLICHAVGPRITYALEVPARVWPIMADVRQLEIALLNLSVNARDAMPEGGALTIAVRNLGPAEQPAHLPVREYVSIAVCDNGEGMSPEVLARATEPFFTTKPPGKGTGLGLSMVRGFAEQSGGCLWIKSGLGVGTTGEIVLPRAALIGLAAAESALDAAAPDPALHGGATILLVEDDELVRPMTAGLLRDLGYTVEEAASAEAASALVHTLERLDLVVTDVAMPGADGPTLAARLRAERPALPVLFVTGHLLGPALAGEAVLRMPFAGADLGVMVLKGLGRWATALPE